VKKKKKNKKKKKRKTSWEVAGEEKRDREPEAGGRQKPGPDVRGGFAQVRR